MSHTITGKLGKDATEFQAGDSTGFGIRLGVQYYDRDTKSKEWCNYEAAVFSNNQAQIAFLRSNLCKDSIVEVSCEQLKIKSFDGQNGQSLSLEMIGAKIGYSFNPNYNPNQQQAPQQQQQAPQQGGFAPQQQQAPQQGYFMSNGQPCPPHVVQALQMAQVQMWQQGQMAPQQCMNIQGWV